ncbi:DUF421 domain-containing protein [Desmospora profundinema]|uniref:Uncharacterized membrane protein YcaP (DUF421 family) n=1 Tax=Desmospora profundinema TaxID=1571184 RepID=A0ABU1IQR7_9BACL|nr:DUF421 domain-containing protein [Desmospora profundinema]MDR6227141.1 uncharacterized membrane protein YcaP (DUF421 family) [Desmospora profundinema]
MEEVHIGLLTIKLVLGFIALFIVIKVTGRTSINQLTPFHLVFVFVLGELVGNMLYEQHVGILVFVYALGVWTVLMWGVEFISQKMKWTRSYLVGDPSIIIRNGMIDREELKKNKLDMNQVLSLLRQDDVFSVREVQYGILEPNGEITVLLKSKYQQPVKQDFNLPENQVDLPTSLIIDGEILLDNLRKLGFDQNWLKKQLEAHHYDNEKDIFYADWRESDGIHISPRSQ